MALAMTTKKLDEVDLTSQSARIKVSLRLVEGEGKIEGGHTVQVGCA